jgi:hypothetical protein
MPPSMAAVNSMKEMSVVPSTEASIACAKGAIHDRADQPDRTLGMGQNSSAARAWLATGRAGGSSCRQELGICANDSKNRLDGFGNGRFHFQAK